MLAETPSVPLDSTPAPVLRIEASRGWVSLRLGEVWEYRELLYFLIWRDIKVRYKQTLLGAAWAVLQPFLTMVVFTLFFGRMAGVGSDGLPYPIFSYAGLLPWTFFAYGLTQCSNSIVGASHLVRRVYFPRLIVPLAAGCSGLVDLGIAFLVLIGMMAVYGLWPAWTLVLVPGLVLLCVGAVLGTGLWLAALNVHYRDVRYLLPFFVQLWLFVTPVIYPASTILRKLEEHGVPPWLYGLNPMAGIVEGFRWALLRHGPAPLGLLTASTLVVLASVASGALYFRRMEKSFADVV